MPRIAKELGPLQVSRLKDSGLHPVGGVAGLMLQVSKTGTRSWLLRVKVGDKRREIGLGAYPGVGVALARDKAQQTRDAIANGHRPGVAARRRHGRPSSSSRSRPRRWTGRSGAAPRRTSRPRNPAGAMPSTASSGRTRCRPTSIRSSATCSCATSASSTSSTSSSRTGRRRTRPSTACATVSSWCSTGRPFASCAPATTRHAGRATSTSCWPTAASSRRSRGTRRCLPNQLYGFMQALRDVDGTAARCLEFVVLTACRSGEARLATWPEIDLKTKTWSIPGSRMKSGRPHSVPLSDEAVALLKALPRLEGTEFVRSPARRRASRCPTWLDRRHATHGS